MPTTSLGQLRNTYLRNISENLLGFRRDNRGNPTEVLSNADKGNASSKRIAYELARLLPQPLCSCLPSAQGAGSLFGQYTKDFLEDSFRLLMHMRPGDWHFSVSQDSLGIARFDQYEHLAYLDELASSNSRLKAALGEDYLITPDITVSRTPVQDTAINQFENIISCNEPVAEHTPLRAQNFPDPKPILSASVSCKWTMRSDRSQNTRTEALNLIRNRKGKTPNIAVVTFEPQPTRLASIALGTGDVDCTYHGALPELRRAVELAENFDQLDLLNTLIDGRRLRDISDLPMDLIA